jgi:hypothetical protein
LRDLEEIQKKGVPHFRKHFKGRTLFGWKSVVRDDYLSLDVPCLVEDGGKVVLDWVWLDSGLVSTNPALRFES